MVIVALPIRRGPPLPPTPMDSKTLLLNSLCAEAGADETWVIFRGSAVTKTVATICVKVFEYHESCDGSYANVHLGHEVRLSEVDVVELGNKLVGSGARQTSIRSCI